MLKNTIAGELQARRSPQEFPRNLEQYTFALHEGSPWTSVFAQAAWIVTTCSMMAACSAEHVASSITGCWRLFLGFVLQVHSAMFMPRRHTSPHECSCARARQICVFITLQVVFVRSSTWLTGNQVPPYDAAAMGLLFNGLCMWAWNIGNGPAHGPHCRLFMAVTMALASIVDSFSWKQLRLAVLVCSVVCLLPSQLLWWSPRALARPHCEKHDVQTSKRQRASSLHLEDSAEDKESSSADLSSNTTSKQCSDTAFDANPEHVRRTCNKRKAVLQNEHEYIKRDMTMTQAMRWLQEHNTNEATNELLRVGFDIQDGARLSCEQAVTYARRFHVKQRINQTTLSLPELRVALQKHLILEVTQRQSTGLHTEIMAENDTTMQAETDQAESCNDVSPDAGDVHSKTAPSSGQEARAKHELRSSSPGDASSSASGANHSQRTSKKTTSDLQTPDEIIEQSISMSKALQWLKGHNTVEETKTLLSVGIGVQDGASLSVKKAVEYARLLHVKQRVNQTTLSLAELRTALQNHIIQQVAQRQCARINTELRDTEFGQAAVNVQKEIDPNDNDSIAVSNESAGPLASHTAGQRGPTENEGKEDDVLLAQNSTDMIDDGDEWHEQIIEALAWLSNNNHNEETKSLLIRGTELAHNTVTYNQTFQFARDWALPQRVNYKKRKAAEMRECLKEYVIARVQQIRAATDSDKSRLLKMLNVRKTVPSAASSSSHLEPNTFDQPVSLDTLQEAWLWLRTLSPEKRPSNVMFAVGILRHNTIYEDTKEKRQHRRSLCNVYKISQVCQEPRDSRNVVLELRRAVMREVQVLKENVMAEVQASKSGNSGTVTSPTETTRTPQSPEEFAAQLHNSRTRMWTPFGNDMCHSRHSKLKGLDIPCVFAVIELDDTRYFEMPVTDAVLIERLQTAREQHSGVGQPAELIQGVASRSLSDRLADIVGAQEIKYQMWFRDLSCKQNNTLRDEAFTLCCNFRHFVDKHDLCQVLYSLPERTWLCCAVFLQMLLRTRALHTLTKWSSFLSSRVAYTPADKVGEHASLAATHMPKLVESQMPVKHKPGLPGQAVLTPPVMCWLCGIGFDSRQALHDHCSKIHQNFAEYRKRLFWVAQRQGFTPVLPWVKRHMLQNFSFFQTHSLPCAGQNDWTRTVSPGGAVQRREEACAVCAVKAWVEHRYQVYMFRPYTSKAGSEILAGMPDAETVETDEEESESESRPEDEHALLRDAQGCFYVSSSSLVHEHLNVWNYAQAMPWIPLDELHASSVQHPEESGYRWLLHTRRVPVLAQPMYHHQIHEPGHNVQHSNAACHRQSDTDRAQETEQSKNKQYRCAGVGDPDRTVWMCRTCRNSLCCAKKVRMPPLALANMMWLGREHLLYQNLTEGMRLLLSLGRVSWRKVILGKGLQDHQQQGIAGNTILLAQPSSDRIAECLPPTAQDLLGSLSVAFIKSRDDVKYANMFTVNRDQYARCVKLRKLMCPVFGNVVLSEVDTAALPENGVPECILQCAVHLPEAEKFTPCMEGPAGCKDPSAPQRPQEDNAHHTEEESAMNASEETCGGSSSLSSDTSPDHASAVFSEMLLGINETHVEDPANLFSVFQAKLKQLEVEAAKVARAELRRSGDLETSGITEDIVEDAGGREACRHIALDLHEVATRIAGQEKTILESACMVEKAPLPTKSSLLVVKAGAPLSVFDPRTYPACFVEFFYGDCVPHIERPVKLSCQQIFNALLHREELQYHLLTDEHVYVARSTSRFDTPEHCAVFADILRRIATLTGVRAAWTRPGFESNLKLIAAAKPSDFAEAAAKIENGTPHACESPGVRQALKHLSLATANVALTEGYKVKLRHIGHASNLLWGPLALFLTSNFSDTYAPLVVSIYNGSTQETLVQRSINLLEDEPAMPSQLALHRIAASSPRTQAVYFLLMEELVYRFLLGCNMVFIGHWQMCRRGQAPGVEDDLASSGDPNLAGGFTLSSLEPLESQGRGFAHGHRKLYSIPNLSAPVVQRLLHGTDQEATEFMQEFRHQLIEAASTIQYESATLPARQLGVAVLAEPFSAQQQYSSRLDGNTEIDGTTRDLLLITPAEKPGHLVREELLATLEDRPQRHAFRETPLTACQQSTLPTYRLPQGFGQQSLLNDVGMLAQLQHESGSMSSLPSLPWQADAHGQVNQFLLPSGSVASADDVHRDAIRWETCFGRDVRALHCSNHSHDCTSSCTKYQKQQPRTATNANPVAQCRFGFFQDIIFHMLEAGQAVNKKIRRRGKRLVQQAFVAATNVRNEFGRVVVERLHPFRSASNDICQAACRCNFDVQFMPRAMPDGLMEQGTMPKMSFYGYRSLSRVRKQIIQCFQHMMLAAQSCDYYMTKYQSKMQQCMGNALQPIAAGLQRLENEQASRPEMTISDKAKQMVTRMAFAANQCHWFSACELAICISTGEHFIYTHSQHTLFLSRPIFMARQCQRLLAGLDTEMDLLEAGDTNINVVAMDSSTAPPPRDPSEAETDDEMSLSGNEADEAMCEPKDGAAQPVQTAQGSEHIGTDTNATANVTRQNENQDKTHESPALCTLRKTCGTHDDWLHRGNHLWPLPYMQYVAYVQRVPKPKHVSADTPLLFAFDPHYIMSRTYCQQLRPRLAIPRIHGASLTRADYDEGEENALQKTILLLPIRCSGPDACCDPTLYKDLVTPHKQGGLKFSPVWHLHRACIQVLADRGQQKTDLAQRLPVVRDTTLVKNFFTLPAHKCKQELLRRTLQQFVLNPSSGLRHVAVQALHWDLERILETLFVFLGVPPGRHPHQLFLAEFAALAARDVATHIDLLAEARSTIHKTTEKPMPAESSDEDVDVKSGHVRGDNLDGYEDCVIDETDEGIEASLCAQVVWQPKDLAELTSVLMRDAEVAAASSPGRHKDSHVQMKGVAAVFGPMMQTVFQSADVLPDCNFMYKADVTVFQKQAARAMRGVDDSVAAADVTLQEQRQTTHESARMQVDNEAECWTVPMEDVLQGPAHVAWQLLEKCKANAEQKKCVALVAEAMQTAWDTQREREPLIYESSLKSLLPLDQHLLSLLLVGGGGCGKTLIINGVLSPLFTAFYGQKGLLKVASSNKAARLLGGRTIHTANGLLATSSLRTSQLRLTKSARPKLEKLLIPCGAKIIDEFSQLQATLFHADCLRSSYARAAYYNFSVKDYNKPGEIMGRMPVTILAGDELQLPPIPHTSGFFGSIEDSSAEHRCGVAIFRSIRYVFRLQRMMRFTDPALRTILVKMRTPGGTKLEDAEWDRLLNTDFGAAQPGVTITQWLHNTEDWYHAAFPWSVVSIIQQLSAARTARKCRQILYYCTAHDSIQQGQGHLTAARARTLLSIPNANSTGRLLGFCPFHLHMRVRITLPIEPPFVIPDSTGTIVGIESPSVPHSHSLPQASLRNIVMMDTFPIAIYVQIDDLDKEFLPAKPCAEHMATGAARSCTACNFFPGLVAVTPMDSRPWMHEEDGVKYHVIRKQFPITPERASTIYTLQGTTTDPGMIFHWVIPKRLPTEITWLCVYVALSRVRSLDQLKSIGLGIHIRRIIEQGPPASLLQSFLRLFSDKEAMTQSAASLAAHRLGWRLEED